MHQEGQSGTVITPGSTEPETNWQYSPNSSPQASPAPEPPDQPQQQPVNHSQSTANSSGISWTASEFISHDKSGSWYLLLAAGGLVLAAVVYLLTRDKVSTGVVVIVAITFGVLAARKPRELEYSVDENGVRIGEKFYAYSGFRSFSIVQEEAVESIWLIPLKRFMPALTLYFDPADGEKIVDVLAQFLPLENRELDLVDKLMHKIRF